MVTSAFRRALVACAFAMLGAGLSSRMLRAEGDQPALLTAQATAISIDNFSFSPAEITIPVGGTITWTNRDDIPHTVVASNRRFRSKVLDTDQSFSFTFSNAGTYEYFCSLHPHMTGKVIVK